MTKLFERYRDQPITSDNMMGRFIDRHRVLKDTFVSAVEGCGYKPVLKWLEFEYQNPKSSAT